MSADALFSFRTARSGALTAGLALAVSIETAVLHLWLYQEYPVWAWISTTLGLLTLGWLAVEYRAWDTSRLRVGAARLTLRVPGRGHLEVPCAHIATATMPSWRELPEAGTPGYLNLMAPAEPNVLLALTVPGRVFLLGGLVRRSVTHVAFRVDEPQRFLHAIVDEGRRA